MADVFSQVKDVTGGLGFSLGGMWDILTYGLILICIIVITGIVVYRILMSKKFSKTITFWKHNPMTGEEVAEVTIKAMPIRVDRLGNIAFKLKKSFETKNLIERLKYEVKPNQYYVHLGTDGRLREFGGISFDTATLKMMAESRDDNTELGRSSMQELSKERYDKPKFLEKHGALLINVGAIAIIMVFLWLIADKLIELVGQIGGLLGSMEKLQVAQSNILESLDNIIRGNKIL